MAAAKKPKDNTAALAADTNVPRISMTGETGFLGLRMTNKQIIEESQRVLAYPAFIKVVNEMRLNPTVGAVMNVYRMFMTAPRWYVEPAVGASEVEKARAAIVESMMHDMEDSWESFIESVVPYLEYGFAVNEMVLRRRLTKNGSKFNDGAIGIKKLATRNQETITGWVFDESGADLIKIEQSLTNIENGYRYQNRTNDSGKIEIPRNKFLLFTASKTKGNPQGSSIYKNIYLSYKQLTLLQDQQLLSIAKDIQGILKIGIPPQYLSADADENQVASVKAFKSIIDNYNAGTQSGLLVPMMTDPETKQPLFSYDLMQGNGTSRNDIESIIQGLQTDILTALSCDVLKLGADGTGSFSLAESKSSILAFAIDSRLKEIKGVLNKELMSVIYDYNGWSKDNMASFCYKDVDAISLDELGKYGQRVGSIGLLVNDLATINAFRAPTGAPPIPEGTRVEDLTMTMSSSSAAQGMQTAGEGTSTKPGGKDSSTSNSENA